MRENVEDCPVITMRVETNGKGQVEIHYVTGDTPGVVEENFEEYFHGHNHFSLEEILQDQESVYQSLQANGVIEITEASGSTVPNVNHEQSGGQIQDPDMEERPPQAGNAKSQLELDEELAIALQEMENQLESASVSETTGSEAVNRELSSTGTSTEAVRQGNVDPQTVREDNVDPDDMTYEELQSLGETIGTESRGLSDELISYLPSFKYKTGFFKKEKHEECVICYMTYKNRERLTTLPCQHQYHSECITKWLKLNKACPVCNEEVFGS